MAPLSDDRYLDALTAQSARFGDALRGADMDQPVPTCPEWTLHELTAHVGRSQRWVEHVVAHRITDPVDPSRLPAVEVPDGADELGRWLRDGAAALVDTIRSVGMRTPVWSFGDDHSVAFWARREAHETSVHRADVELARGRDFTLDPDLAADAITEWLQMLCSDIALRARPSLAALRGEGEVLHLHSTDAGLGEAGEWIVRRTPAGPVWEHGHAKGAVAIRGAVVDLLLLLMRRVPVDESPAQVLGDRAVLDHWLEHTRF